MQLRYRGRCPVLNSLSPFAVVFVIFLLFAFAFCRKRADFAVVLFAVVCILDMNMISTPLVVIGGQEISCSDFVLVLFPIFALAAISKDRIPLQKYAFVAALILVIVFSLSVLYNGLFPYGEQVVTSGTSWDRLVQGTASRSEYSIGNRNLLVLVRYALFAFSGVLVVSLFKRADFLRIGRWIIVAGKVHICFALFELFTKVMMESSVASQITSFFFADTHVYTMYIQRDSLVALWGMTREPSHFALALGFFVVVFLLVRSFGLLTRKELAWPVVAIALAGISGASSTVVLLPPLALFALALYQIRRTGRVRFLSVFFAFVALMLGAYMLSETEFGRSLPYFAKAQGVLDSLAEAFRGDYLALWGTEGTPRMVSIVESIRTWMAASPLFGIGVGGVNPFSGVFALLANTGLVGFTAWLMYLRSLQGVKRVRYAYLLLMLVVVGTMTFIGQEGSTYSFSLLLIAPLISYSLKSVRVVGEEVEEPRGPSRLSKTMLHVGKRAYPVYVKGSR